MTFRIRRYDNKNLIIEEFVKGGVNPRTREKAQDKWALVGYYSKLKDLAIALLDKQIVLPKDGAVSGQEILQAIKEAEVRIKELVESFSQEK